MRVQNMGKKCTDILRDLRSKFWKEAVVGFLGLGLLLTAVLTQTDVRINQTPSFTHKAFICLKSLKPRRGDFISLQCHPTAYFGDIHYVKRLIGLPGDRIHIKDNQTYVEDALIGPIQTTTQDGKPLHPLQSLIIPKGYVFVSADHPRSFDSRYEEFGLVKEEHLTGRCFGFFKSNDLIQEGVQ